MFHGLFSLPALLVGLVLFLGLLVLLVNRRDRLAPGVKIALAVALIALLLYLSYGLMVALLGGA